MGSGQSVNTKKRSRETHNLPTRSKLQKQGISSSPPLILQNLQPLQNRYQIRSKLALFYIYMASRSETHTISVETACNIWLMQRDLIYVIDEKAKELPYGIVDKSIFFALHVMFHVIHRQYMWSTHKKVQEGIWRTCEDGAKNFIISMAVTNRMNCLAYVHYMLAVAEEFGYGLISCCSKPKHIQIVISNECDSKKEVALQNCESKSYSLYTSTDFDFCLDRKMTRFSKINTCIHVGRGYAVIESTKFTKDEFVKQFCPYGSEDWVKVLKAKEIICNDDVIWYNSIWNVLESLIVMIGARKNMTQEKYDHDISVLNYLWKIDLIELVSLRNILKDEYSENKRVTDFDKKKKDLTTKILEKLKKISTRLKAFPMPKQVKEILNSPLLSANNERSYDLRVLYPHWNKS